MAYSESPIHTPVQAARYAYAQLCEYPHLDHFTLLYVSAQAYANATVNTKERYLLCEALENISSSTLSYAARLDEITRWLSDQGVELK